MALVGLTGGIGSGKSAVASILVAKGYQLVDADQVARFVVEKGSPTLLKIAEEFGTEVLTEDGSLDRPKLGAIVFGDSAKLEKLNSIIHPAIAIEMQRRIDEAIKDDSMGMVFVDVPLLAETGGKDRYRLNFVVVVDISEDLQIFRLTQFRKITEEDARSRIRAQAARDERLSIADFVIDNSGSLVDLEIRVDEVLEQMENAIRKY
ncbi:MAG: dephospho-CoA kinase [Actinomycetota bacterium]|nr:dephospho-CoA kinase [Actinomycetota bacterium]